MPYTTQKTLKANSDKEKKLSRVKPYAYLRAKSHFDVLRRPYL